MIDARFLHCLPKKDYLLSCIENGFMLTDHKVSFRFSTHVSTVVSDLYSTMLPCIREPNLRRKFEAFINTGGQYSSSDKGFENILYFLGPHTQQVPMLCFTEIVGFGRDLQDHITMFGRFGITVKQEWLLQNGADRVIYIGDNRPAGTRLARMAAALRLYSILANSYDSNFDMNAMRFVLDFACYVEVSHHMDEFEWRIVGEHGMLQSKSDTGKRLSFNLADIQTVFVDRKEDIPDVQAALRTKASADSFLDELPSIQLIEEVFETSHKT